MTAAQVAARSARRWSARRRHRSSSADGQPISLVVQLDPEQTWPRSTTSRRCPVGDRGQGAAGDDRDGRGSRRPGQHHPDRPGRRRRSITAEITSDDTGARVAGRSRPSSTRSTRDGRDPGRRRPSELAGVSQQQSEAFGGLFASMGVAILLVYVMMVLTFNSLITPFIILFTLPLAHDRRVPGAAITGRPIGVSALIGFLMLIGIVVTNAIVLLDLVERLRAEGHSTRDALIEGGRTRVRPILMTAHRDDPGADPARRGLQPGLDHRRRARHGRHRRPVQRDVPDADRHPGRLLARRRPARLGLAAVHAAAHRRGRGSGRTRDSRPRRQAPRADPRGLGPLLRNSPFGRPCKCNARGGRSVLAAL